MSIVSKALKIRFIKKYLYPPVHEIRKKNRYRKQFSFHGEFIDRAKGYDKLCIVLCGYKPYLYDSVLGRLKKVIPSDIDVCLVTSGLYDERIAQVCEESGYSYLHTRENSVGLVQNVAIQKHPNAKLIFKLDEDIFLTDNYFERMQAALEHAKTGKYNPGIIAPIIPINGYGYERVLERFDLREIYEKRFGRIVVGATQIGKKRVPIEQSAEVAKFFWGWGGYCPSVDKMNDTLGKLPLEERPCPVRFSIGAILFERNLWESMNYYSAGSDSLGKDEEQLCSFCCLNSSPIMVSENVLVGHFSFGKQNEAMKEFFVEHPECFK